MEKPDGLGGQKWEHHVNPRLYLKGFIEKGSPSMIWVYKKGEPYNPGRKQYKNNPWKTSTKRAGVQGGYYADIDAGGQVDSETYEDLLMEREQPADHVIAKIRQQQLLSEEERDIFAQYIAQMLIRGPRARRNVETMLPNLVSSFENDSVLLQRLSGPDGGEKRARLRRVLDKIAQREGLAKQTHLRTLSTRLERAMVILLEMRWTFFVAQPGDAFLTGDNPVFFFKDLGLKKSTSELSFPMSSEVAFVASWRKERPEGFAEAKSKTVVALNRRTASFAFDELYFSRDEPWVLNLFGKTHQRPSLRL